MNRVLIYCLLYLVCSNYAQETADGGTPHVQVVDVALKLLDAIKSTSSTSIGPVTNGDGFSRLNNNFDISRGAVLISKLPQLIDTIISDLDDVDETVKNVIVKVLKEYALQLSEESYYKQKYSLNFNNGKGVYFMLILAFDPHPTNVNAIYWTKQLMFGSFTPSLDWAVVTESDCDLVSCSRTDRISYLPAKITENHIRAIYNINADMLSGYREINKLSN